MAAAVWFTDDTSESVSAVTAFTDDAISTIDVVTCCAAVAISCAVLVDALDRRAALLHRRRHLSTNRAGEVSVLAVTCSIEAATSLIDDDQALGRAADRFGLGRRLLERGRHLVDAAQRVVERSDLGFGALRTPRR